MKVEMIWPGLFDGWPHTCPNLHTARCVVHSDGRKKEHRTGGRFERTSKCIESGFAGLWVSNLVFVQAWKQSCIVLANISKSKVSLQCENGFSGRIKYDLSWSWSLLCLCKMSPLQLSFNLKSVSRLNSLEHCQDWSVVFPTCWNLIL